MCLFRFKTKITEPSPEYQSWLSKQKSIQDIINFANDFTYISDKEQFGKTDYWQTPNEFFKSKRGDCEDMHLFMADTIHRVLGLNTYLLIAWNFIPKFPFMESHAMTVYYDNNGYHLINYNRRIPMSSLRDITAIKQAGFKHIGAIFQVPEGKRV